MHEYTRLESEYSRIDDDFLNTGIPDIVKVKYDKIIEKVQRIEREQDRRQEREYEISFIDDYDGKTVHIRGPGSSLKVETTRFLRFVNTATQESGDFPIIENQVNIGHVGLVDGWRH